MDKIIIISIIQYLTIRMIPDISDNIVNWVSWGFLVLSVSYVLITESRIQINKFIIWQFTFLIFSCIGFTISENPILIIEMIKNLFIEAITLGLIAIYINSKKRLILSIKGYVIAASFMLLYIAFKSIVDWNGYNILSLGEAWNGNVIGLIASTSALFILWLRKFKTSLLYNIQYLGFTLLVLATTSRKSILLLIGGSILFLYLTTPKYKRLRILIIGTISIFILSYFLLTIPWLYELIGIRFSGAIAALSGQEGADSSSLLRLKYIDLAKTLFIQKPIFGYGLDNFRIFSEKYFMKATYSHNNYLELLVSVGLFGTLVYYYIYFVIIKRLITKSKINEYAVFLTLMVLLTILDLSIVSYSLLLIKYVILMCYTASKFISFNYTS